ncbi:hypothetical protein [Acinetobacter nosocomialis]|uniref:hypothetical protein n=1 Tax=Acinetobacter nosocomialis TaxID=106654 RepID=UPI0020111F4A|nr:hypothetical protein [Acinetobacter nosocomialis]
MDNYKIINTHTNEIIKALNDLGYVWTPKKFDEQDCLLKAHWILAKEKGGIAYSSGTHIDSPLVFTELTLPQLRDLVVLKRNDVKDATHRDKRDESIYLTSDKVIYYWQGEWCKSAINKSNDYENYIANSLTPITQPQDPALISGADVPALIKKGESVQFRSVFNVQGGGEWQDLNLERDEEEFSLGDLINTRFEWRLKPQTIKLELEIPAPYKAKIGGRDDTSFVLNIGRHQYCYKNEDDYTKARDALEAVFDSALRGTNS